MTAAFLSDLILKDIGGGFFQLVAPLRFASADLDREVQAPAGVVTDLASIPNYVPGWMIPKLGDYDYPAVIHDAGLDHTLQDAQGQTLIVTKAQTDRLFLEGMTARNVNVVQREWMYWAVSHFGREKVSNRKVTAAWTQ